jgi:hypothetical protein
MVNRQTLKFEEPDGSPLVLFATHAKAVLEHKLKVILAEIDTLFPGELYGVDSTDENYNFLALHFGYYNKYSENVSVFSISADS